MKIKQIQVLLDGNNPDPNVGDTLQHAALMGVEVVHKVNLKVVDQQHPVEAVLVNFVCLVIKSSMLAFHQVQKLDFQVAAFQLWVDNRNMDLLEADHWNHH